VDDGKLWDVIIVGQGLAGTTLAWQLLMAGQRVLVLDAEQLVTSSKIAAGLITPITGQRMALSWQIDAFLPFAEQFYAAIEQRTGGRFFHTRTAVRLFGSVADQRTWMKRLEQPGYQERLTKPQPRPVLASELGAAEFGGFAMHAAQLDVGAYLAASRTAFAATDAYAAMTLNWHHDVTIDAETVGIRQLRTRRLISCEGYGATTNPYFADVPFKAAKGEILTIRVERAMPPHSLHRDVWVAPTAEPDVFRVGSTYDWKLLDQVPTAAARAEIERKLRGLLHVPYTVLDHQAAVRPIIHLSEPIVGMHRRHQRLGYFNGLGSKGALHAPWFAHGFTNFLVHGTRLPDAMKLGVLG
jgi:glycine oxidase